MTSARTRERLVQRLAAHGIHSEAVLDRIRTVPRHLFVDEALASRAYEDSSLPIGHGQTISQPYIVALMTQALIQNGETPRALKKVLEVGTGCGYQTAVLASLAAQIYTIERIGALQQQARQRLVALGVNNVRYRHGDGFEGWPGQAPFDGIVVTAAPGDLPQVLLDQLGPDGRLIIPVGVPGSQELVRIRRTESGFVRDHLCWVSFVPLLEGKG